MEKHKRYQKAGIVLLVLILLAVSGIYMGIDRYMVGDEIVTYGMADSTDRGWMLSTGGYAPILRARFWKTLFPGLWEIS